MLAGQGELVLRLAGGAGVVVPGFRLAAQTQQVDRAGAVVGGDGEVLAEGAPLGMSIMLLAHICPAGQATHPVAIAVTTHG